MTSAMSSQARDCGAGIAAAAEAAEAHVVLFPFPVQGHLNSMLNLAELLCLSGIRVTFLNSRFNHARHLSSSGGMGQHPLERLPNFHFAQIDDGLPEDVPRSIHTLKQLRRSVQVVGRSQLVTLVSTLHPPVTCVVADFVMAFATDVGAELDVPVVLLCSVSACSFWVYFSVPDLFQAGELPFPASGEEPLDELVKGIRGMETARMRRRDLPLAFRSRDLSKESSFTDVVAQILRAPLASAFVVNTFEWLEEPIVSLLRSDVNPTTYAVGPLHALLLETKKTSSSSSSSARMSLWEEERECMRWLDAQADKSVLYVAFGSLAVMSSEQVEEICHGLVASGQRFLWAMRVGSPAVEEVIVSARRERRCLLVRWAPQEEVLAHPAVGGFFTHSGWNSTLEGIVAGVPMLCWPFFADQQVNSRYVSEVWRLALDIKDRCDRSTVQRAVLELMTGEQAEASRASAATAAEMARQTVMAGGSSHTSFLRLVSDIKGMRLRPPSMNREPRPVHQFLQMPTQARDLPNPNNNPPTS